MQMRPDDRFGRNDGRIIHAATGIWVRLLLVNFSLWSSSASVGLVDAGSSDMTHLVDKLLLNYSRQISPHGDNPTVVELGIYLNSIYSISEQTMDYSVNIYLRQQWQDPRMRFDPKINGGQTMIKLEDNMWNRLWVPDIFFRNEKRADFHQVTIPNRLMRLHSDGTIWYATKISATLSCMMNLQKYPLDTQTCPMMLESFGYTMKTVIFRWLQNNSVEQDKELSMPQFTLVTTTVRDCSRNYSTGSYPCHQVDFILQRHIGYFIIQMYVPTTLIVILSWVGFWINIEAIPARVSLGLLTVLTMTAQSSGSGASLPRVSYVKAIDVWMCVCLVFVFASLLEFALVNVFSRRVPKHHRKAKKRNEQLRKSKHYYRDLENFSDKAVPHFGIDPIDSELKSVDIEAIRSYGINSARKIDKLSRRLFPLSFLLFNTVYWIIYTIVK